MNSRTLIVVMLALGAGLGTAFLVRNMPRGDGEGTVETVSVLVLSADVPSATTLTKDLLTTSDYPESELPPGALLEASMVDVLGMKARFPLKAGELLFPSKITDRTTISPMIPKGRMAVSISVPNPENSISGLIQPEDRVNIVFVPNQDKHGALTIMRNVRLIATNRRLYQPADDEAGTDRFEKVSEVTLEVGKKDVEMLSWCSRNGSLNLSLRSWDDQQEEIEDPSLQDVQKFAGVVLAEPVAPNVPDSVDPKKPETTTVLVAARAISRYTRLTMGMLTTAEWPKEFVPSKAIQADAVNSVLGKWADVSLSEGEMLFPTKITDRVTFSKGLGAGMVAFKIVTDTGLLLPNDRVNIVFASHQGGAGHDGALTMLYNKRVIATNDKPPTDLEEGETDVEHITSAILEVSPTQAELLSWASTRGRLSLALLSDNHPIGGSDLTLASFQEELGAKDKPEDEKKDLVALDDDSKAQMADILELRNRALGKTTLRIINGREMLQVPSDK